MRYCTHPSHRDNKSIPWILDNEPDHKHEKPKVRLVDGKFVPVPTDSASESTK